jgi:hypothetical protein
MDDRLIPSDSRSFTFSIPRTEFLVRRPVARSRSRNTTLVHGAAITLAFVGTVPFVIDASPLLK